MKMILLVVYSSLITVSLSAQSVKVKLQNAYQQFESDSQLKHAISSLYIINERTGEIVFAKNSQIGLAPASTQKIITATTAFELLGKNYKYKTEVGYSGSMVDGILKGNLHIVGSGDPTLGSWRYVSSIRDSVLSKIFSMLKIQGIREISGDVILDDSRFSFQPLPGGWIWDDIGNYYGAGVWALNWNENQYDLVLKPGLKEGDSVQLLGTEPQLEIYSLTNLMKSGKPGSGDNGYIYLAPYAVAGFVDGTVPAGEKIFGSPGQYLSLPINCLENWSIIYPAKIFGLPEPLDRRNIL